MFKLYTCIKPSWFIPELFAGPPSEPLDLAVTYIDESSVKMSWNVPEDLGGRSDLRYRIECQDCDDSVLYTPRQSGFNITM